MGGFTLPALPDLLAASNLSFADLGSWQPPDSATGPQNNNVIQYSKAAGAAMGCDPMKGCQGSTPANVQDAQTDSPWWTKIGAPPITMDQMRGNVKAGLPATTGAVSQLSVGRIAAFLLGLICIAGGIFLFGTAQFENPTVQRIVGAAAIV
jgi:hypothetical protein